MSKTAYLNIREAEFFWQSAPFGDGATENAGLEFGGPNSRVGKCRTGKCRTKRFLFFAIKLFILQRVLVISASFSITAEHLCY